MALFLPNRLRKPVVDGRGVLATVEDGVDVDDVAIQVVENRKGKTVRHGSMEAAVLGVDSAVAFETVDVFEQAADEVGSRSFSLRFVELGADVEVALSLGQDSDLHP